MGGEREGRSSEVKRVSGVGKWERTADIRIASRHMQQAGSRMGCSYAQLAAARRPQSKIKAQRETGRRRASGGLCTKLAR